MVRLPGFWQPGQIGANVQVRLRDTPRGCSLQPLFASRCLKTRRRRHAHGEADGSEEIVAGARHLPVGAKAAASAGVDLVQGASTRRCGTDASPFA